MGPTATSGVREHSDVPDGPSLAPAPVRRPTPVPGRPGTGSWSSTGTGAAGIADDALAGSGREAVSRTLPADLASVRQARAVVRDTLVGWCADAIYDDVALVASELVSNALRHGLQLDRRPGQCGDAADPEAVEPGSGSTNTVELSLCRDGDHVICAVSDPSQEPPVRRPEDVLAGSGHGLQLVDSLSLCWGWRMHEAKTLPAQRRGKSVWAAFPFRMVPAPVVGAA